MPRPRPIPNNSAGSAPTRFVASGFPATDWRLLVRLPAEVMITAISIQDGPWRRTVPEGLAGLDAIAAGRSSDSDLVRAVVGAIYAEPEDERAHERAQRPDPDAQRARVLGDCRRAAEILRGAADPADAAAYRHWVQQVAVRVCAASRPGGVLGVRDRQRERARFGVPERAFLDELGAVLS